MKNIGLLLCATVLTLTGYQAHAEESRYALGAVIGDPTGISGRMKYDGAHSLEGAVAYGLGHRSGLHLHATYIWDRARTFETEGGPFWLYYGLGGRLVAIDHGDDDGSIAIGPRAPVGLIFNLEDPNIEIFGELALALDITPSTDVDLDAAIGVRIRF